MITTIALVGIALIATFAVARPIVNHARKPWLFDAPNADEEMMRQEQIMALDALRDLAMDYRMGQLSQEDYRAMAAPLQKKAKQTLEHQMGQDLGIANRTDADLDAELEAAILALRTVTTPVKQTETQFCTQCGEKVEASFQFCGFCGTAVAVPEKPDVIQPDATTIADSTAEPAHTVSSSGAVSSTGSVGADTNTKKPSMRRWWLASAVFTAIWIGVIVWIYLNGRAGQETQVAITTLPDGPVVALAATTERALVSSTTGLHVSTDIEAWSQLPTDDIFLSVAPVDQANDFWIGAGSTGLWQTLDNGESWSMLENQPDQSIQRIVASQDGLLWGINVSSLFKSADQGRTWILENDQMPGAVRALAVGPTDLFIGTDQGVYRSPDQGQNWIDSNSVVNGRIGSTDIQALAYDAEGNNLFAGTPLGLYFLNLENVGGWGRRSLDADVRALSIPVDANNILWLGTANGEVFRSSDRGVTWRN